MASGSGESIEIVNGDRIQKALPLALKAHKTPEKPFLKLKVSKTNPQEVFISFSGSGSVKDWYSQNQKPFGECQVNPKLFPSLKTIGYNESAKVNEAFQKRFQAILLDKSSSLENEVEKAMKKNKQIVFTGHSSGAAMAILATLWTLEKYPTPKSHGEIPPLCITFGSPLVGNHIFSHAIRRKNWSEYFIHFVIRYDIVPRILFAPLSSYDQKFESISQSFTPKSLSKSSTSDSIGRSTSNEAYDFYFAVMSNAATVTNFAASKLMGTTDTILETMANFVQLSPYRPFGTYIFCTENGKKIVIKNPDAVLQILFFSAQYSSESEAGLVANRSLQEHRVYGTKLQLTSGMLNFPYLNQEQLLELPLIDDDSRDDIGMALGLGRRARLCLRAAAELEKRRSNNETLIRKKLNSVEEKMKGLEDYKASWKHTKLGYYDAFKNQQRVSDFDANVKRLEISSVWDEIIEKLRYFELPEDFEINHEWIELGTKFRRLVEPIDIANYYRHSREVEAGSYLGKGKGRGQKYKYTQRWLDYAEGKEAMKEGSYSESCFWAEVEDLCIMMKNKNYKGFQSVKERVVTLEEQVKKWVEEKVLDLDVFLEGSTLVKLWKGLPQEHKRGSCIKSFIEVSVK